jgi:UDP-N-acetylglucosamine acyltransferase
LGIYSGVAKDLPPYVIVSGQPAMPRGVNIEGLRRRNFTVEQIRNIKTAYKLLYTSDLRLEEALEKISGLDEVSNELQVMLDFLQASTRGIIR